MATAIKARPAGIRWMVRGLSILACIALWQVASTTHLNLGIVTFRNVPPPVEVVQSALALFRSPKLTAHVTSSLWRVFAGYGAQRMGLPIDRLVIATNHNDILHRTLETGEYRRGALLPSTSPSMDIQVSSNFERLLFELYDREGAAVSALMGELARDGGFRLSQGALDRLRADFIWGVVGNVLYSASQFGVVIALAKLVHPEQVGEYAIGMAVSAPIAPAPASARSPAWMPAPIRLRTTAARRPGTWRFSTVVGTTDSTARGPSTPISIEAVEIELRNSIARGYCQSFADYSRDLAGAAIPLPIGDRRLSVVVAGPEFRIGPKVPEVAALIARTVDRLRPKTTAA